MALNIGQINFGVDANTAGLQKAIKQLDVFAKKTSQIARGQVKAVSAEVAARSRQESAIKKSFQQVLQLQKAMRKAGAPAADIAKVTLAFKRLTTEMSSGQLNILKFNRSMDAFQAKMGRSRRGLESFRQSTAKGAKGLGRYNVLLRDLESSAVLALGPLSGLGSRIRSMSAIISRGAIPAGVKWLAGLAGLAIGLGVLGVKAAIAGDRMKGLMLRLEAAVGGTAQAGLEFGFVARLANKLGLEVTGLTKTYGRFLAATQGTNLEGRKSRIIFEQIARSAAALKLSMADVEGVMRAIEQIMSKGTVQAEELRGQLGDRLPGAFRIAANAMGVSTRELNRMLKAGEVLSDDFLPKFAAEMERAVGKNAERNLQTMSGAWNVLKNNMFLALAALDKNLRLSDAAAGLTLAFGNAIGLLTGDIAFMSEKVRKANDEWEVMVEVLRELEAGPDLGKKFTDLKDDMQDLAVELTAARDAIAEFGRTGQDIDFLVAKFTKMEDIVGANDDTLEALALKLSFLSGSNVEATATGIAAGFAAMEMQLTGVNDALDRIRDMPDLMKEIARETDTLQLKVKALQEGGEQGKLFDKVTDKVREFRAVISETITDDILINKLVAERLALLTEIFTLTTRNAAAKKATTKLAAEEAAAAKKSASAIREASQAIEIMRARVAALAKGPESLEIFEKIEEPLLKMTQSLMQGGVETEELTRLTGLYLEQLEQMFVLTDRWARADEAAAQAITNGLEGILVKGNSVKDMLRSLAEEMLRVILRAGILDQLQSALSGLFGGFTSPKSIVGGGSKSGAAVKLASGGSFKVPGSGGSDSVGLFVKPGEIVSVSRQDQIGARRGGGGGGGVNLTINAPGADAGTIERIKEIVRTELAPQIIRAATDTTMARLKRPRFA